MFVLKKIIGLLTQPGTIVLLILGYGTLQMARSRGSKKKGVVILGVGLVCFYLFTTAPLTNYLLHTLENRYEPVTLAQNFSDIKYIVVLSGGLRLNKKVPPTSQLAVTTALRVAEGMRLFHLLSGDPILVMSGGGPWGDTGERMAALARSLGIPPAKLLSENQSQDTHGNAVWVRALVKDQPFLLVTSAAHMPRAMGIFQRLGMTPRAAPGDCRYRRQYSYEDFFPSGDHLTSMEHVIHEYLGLAYLYLFPGRAGK